MESLFSKKNLPMVILNVSTILIASIMLMVSEAAAKPKVVEAIQTFSSGVLSYQGTITDKQGTPLTGIYEMTFRIYLSSVGGTAMWTESRVGSNAVPVDNGLFNVMLGSLVPIPATVWETPELFLGVKIGSDAEMTPREKLMMVPSAARADVADLALTVPDGSIGADQFADGAISSKNVSLEHGELYGSGEVLTLTASPQIIPSLSFTLNPQTPQILQVSVSLDSMFFPSCSTLLARVEVDNNPVGPILTLASYSNVNVRSSISTTRQVNLTSGVHSVNFKAWCETSGAGTLGQILTGQSSVAYILFSQ